MNKIKNIYLKISLVFLVLSISSCFKWEIFQTLNDIPESKKNELLNAPTEIIFENEKYTMDSFFYKPKPKFGRESENEKKTISFIIRKKTNKEFNIDFFNIFEINTFYIINQENSYYFSNDKIEESFSSSNAFPKLKVFISYNINDIFYEKNKNLVTLEIKNKKTNEKIYIQTKLSII